MMDHFLTTKVFKQGLTNYLNGKWVKDWSTLQGLISQLLYSIAIVFIYSIELTKAPSRTICGTPWPNRRTKTRCSIQAWPLNRSWTPGRCKRVFRWSPLCEITTTTARRWCRCVYDYRRSMITTIACVINKRRAFPKARTRLISAVVFHSPFHCAPINEIAESRDTAPKCRKESIGQ